METATVQRGAARSFTWKGRLRAVPADTLAVWAGIENENDAGETTAAIETIRNRTFPTVGQHVAVCFSSLGDDGVLLGAAALVLRNELGIV